MKGKRNPVAKALRTPAFKMQVVETNKNAYTRKAKHKVNYEKL